MNTTEPATQPVQQPVVPPPVSPGAKRSFNPVVVVGGLILLGLVGVASYYVTAFALKTSSPSVSTQLLASPVPQVEMADWKTYTNSNYKYSFSYPPNYNFRSLTLNVIAEQVDNFILEGPYDSLETLTPEPKYGIHSRVEKTRGRSLNDYLQEVKNSFQNKVDKEDQLSATAYMFEGLRYASLESPPYSARVAVFTDGNVFVELEQKSLQTDDPTISDTQTFDQIISTFSFTQ